MWYRDFARFHETLRCSLEAFAVQGHISILQTHSRAEGAAICGRNPDRTNAIAEQFGIPADVETDDIAAAWFHHECGVHGQWFASRATPRSGENGWLEVTGPEGALRASLSRGTVDRLEVYRPNQTSWEPLSLPPPASTGVPHCLTAMMSSFVDACIKGHSNVEMDATFVDGMAAQQGIDAVLTANNTRTWIPLPEIFDT